MQCLFTPLLTIERCQIFRSLYGIFIDDRHNKGYGVIEQGLSRNLFRDVDGETARDTL